MSCACDNIYDPSYPFYHKFGRQPLWIRGEYSCFTPKRQAIKEIELLCSLLTYSKTLV